MEIRQILDGVESMEMVMPEFQREYVWPIEDAKQLIISMYKGYPTGCLLFWETENPPEVKNKAVDTNRIGLTKVILDGQQRLTTLYMYIKGEIPPYYTKDDIINDPRHLYFNLLNGDFQFYLRNKMESNPLWQSLIECFDESKVDPFDITEAYVAANPEEDFRTIMKRINSNLTRLRAIKKASYPILTVPKNADIDEAIDVFDKVNSQGTKLTDAELVLTHITGRWPLARRVMKDKILELKRINYRFDLDFLTRCMVITLTESALYKKNSRLKYENFSKEDYINAWDKVSKALDYLIPILKQDALILSTWELNTNNVLVPLVAYLVKNENRFRNHNKFRFLRWMFLALIWGRYSGQTDQRLDKDINIIYNTPDPVAGLIAQIEDQRGRLEVKPADLEGRGAQNALYRILYIVTKFNKAIDWANGGPIYDTMGKQNAIQSHHIFPQGYLYQTICDSDNHLDRKKVNEIANRAFITRDTNYSIRNTPPSEYLPKVESEYPGALSKQFIAIEPELWLAENYDLFLEARRESIAKNINAFLDGLDKEGADIDSNGKSHIDWVELIQKGESNFVEFKSTLRTCLKEQKPMKYISHSIAKTVGAFLNSDGGTLFIGVDDDGKILGLDSDYQFLKKSNQKDDFKLQFDNLIRNYIGKENLTDIKGDFVSIEGKDIFIVKVDPSSKPVFISQNGKDEFFVRASASTLAYSTREALEYIERHWN